jgi:hypothetical protein
MFLTLNIYQIVAIIAIAVCIAAIAIIDAVYIRHACKAYERLMKRESVVDDILRRYADGMELDTMAMATRADLIREALAAARNGKK